MVMVGLKPGTALIEREGMAKVANGRIRTCEWEIVWNQPDGANRIPTVH